VITTEVAGLALSVLFQDATEEEFPTVYSWKPYRMIGEACESGLVQLKVREGINADAAVFKGASLSLAGLVA